MTSVADELYVEQSIVQKILIFCRDFQVGKALKAAGAYRSKGISLLSIVTYLINLVFMQKTMYRDCKSKESVIGASIDSVYRFMRLATTNWTTFLLHIATKVIAWMDKLTSDERRSALILDDTVFERPYSKETELVATVHDHAENKFKKGFLTLFLGWTDGFSFVPLAFRHMSSQNKELRHAEIKGRPDKRTNGWKAKKEALMSKLDVALRMLQDAKRYAVPAKYVLFDSWFTNPTFVIKVLEIGFDIVGRMKNGATKYLQNGVWCNLLTIYYAIPKAQRRKKQLFSTVVTIRNDKGHTTAAKIVFTKNTSDPTDWVAFLCTDLSLSDEDVIALYGKRWKIEEFFRVCKHYLKFTGEFRQTSYEAITAHTSIVSVRYMILSVCQRQTKDNRNEPGDIFFLFCDEVKDIRYEEAFNLIVLLIFKLKAYLEFSVKVTEDQMEKFARIFMETVPREIQLRLAPKICGKLA